VHRVLCGIVLASVALAASVVPVRAQESFFARLSPQNTEAEARSVFEFLQRRFPSVLGGYQPLIQPVNLGSGILYFIGVGPFDRIEQARLAFLSGLCPDLSVIDDDDNYYHAVSISKVYDADKVKKLVEKLVAVVQKLGEPKPIEDVTKAAGMTDVKQAAALASVSKQLATLNGRWGLVKWPMVNPKNIRDKIYVILKENGKHMHFNQIAAAIKDSDFKRKDVTTQAIHNELIKDKRFVLIGRGIYALKEFTVEKKPKGWFYRPTYGTDDEWKGPYTSMASVTLMIARRLRKEIAKRDEVHQLTE